MGKRRQLILEYDTPERRQRIFDRDRGRCVVCGGKFHDIHEIVSRSHWASTPEQMELCFSDKNSVCICRYHHNEYQGVPEKITELLLAMEKKYGYEYEEYEFAKYL